MKSPYIYAVLASGYIACVVLLMNGLQHLLQSAPDTMLAPLSMLSLLVLSVAVMSFLFFYEPARLFLEGKRTEALDFFARTVAAFAVLTAALFIATLLIE